MMHSKLFDMAYSRKRIIILSFESGIDMQQPAFSLSTFESYMPLAHFPQSFDRTL
ncbi:hypothetical protein BURPS668_A0983 [Burkholderia pseudomallei 668]|nr:hypothetical protein BURPS668_A0983 [Burkholderia pseudomallei 668]